MYTNIPFFLESHCGEQHGGSLKKLKIELPYDPAIPLGSYTWAYTLRSSYSLRQSLDMEVNLHREGEKGRRLKSVSEALGLDSWVDGGVTEFETGDTGGVACRKGNLRSVWGIC